MGWHWDCRPSWLGSGPDGRHDGWWETLPCSLIECDACQSGLQTLGTKGFAWKQVATSGLVCDFEPEQLREGRVGG